ncbi:MAG: Arc family DNA-binding protein, partial [Gammaproteobacteria bacterium]|nr:Arc family DNA-binding protein [Gammaproteobacteria bacterium]
MSKKIPKTAIRLPKNLHAKILNAAEGSGCSMNSEIITRLSDSFGQKGDAAEFADALDAVKMTQERLVSSLYRRLRCQPWKVKRRLVVRSRRRPLAAYP